MTCGMLCVMRRERRGVLHLDKYSPPKAKLVRWKRREKGEKKIGEEKRKEKEKKEERQRKGKKTSSSLINKQRSCKQ